MVLGVSRSGTSLLRQILNHHSKLAIPPESYFIPILWDRYRSHQNVEKLLTDVGFLVRLRQWGVRPEEIRTRLPSCPAFADVIQAIYKSYAEARGKARFGDKTPLYMRHLELLEQVFPTARYIHIVRDGRNAALSYFDMPYRPRFSWAWPKGFADFALCWRNEIAGARSFGATVAAGRYCELRYEDLVTEPEAKLREVCSFLNLELESAMLEYYRDLRPSGRRLTNHARLAEPPTPGLRDWRNLMKPADLERFEAIAGELLSGLGYARAFANPSKWARVSAAASGAVSYGRSLLVSLAMPVLWRSPVWRWRQAYTLRRAGHPF
jgi:hypothetical protein